MDACKEGDQEVNAEKTLMPRHQNAVQNHKIKIANRSFENLAKLKYSATTVTSECDLLGN
jgi:hypothetical protein